MTPGAMALLARLAEAAVAGIWQGLLLSALVALALCALRRLSAGYRSVVWVLTLVLVVAAPLWSYAHLPGVHAASGLGTGLSTGLWLDPRWSFGLLALWFLLSVAQLARLCRDLAQGAGIRRRAVPSGVDGVWESAEVTRPCVAGLLRPRVLLPLGVLARLSAGEQLQIVLHEREHIRRGDPWTQLGYRVALVLLPVSPALFWIGRELAAERERACDDRVLRETGARKGYAVCLARLAEHALVVRGQAALLGAWSRRPELLRRVERILRPPMAEMTGWRASTTLGALLCGAVLLGGLAARVPPLVRFGTAPAGASSAEPLPMATAASLTELAPFHTNGVTGGSVRLAAMTVPAGAPPARRWLTVRAFRPRRHGAAQAVRSLRTTLPAQRGARTVQVAWSADAAPTQLPTGGEAAPAVATLVYLVPVPEGWLVIRI